MLTVTATKMELLFWSANLLSELKYSISGKKAKQKNDIKNRNMLNGERERARKKMERVRCRRWLYIRNTWLSKIQLQLVLPPRTVWYRHTPLPPPPPPPLHLYIGLWINSGIFNCILLHLSNLQHKAYNIHLYRSTHEVNEIKGTKMFTRTCKKDDRDDKKVFFEKNALIRQQASRYERRKNQDYKLYTWIVQWTFDKTFHLAFWIYR